MESMYFDHAATTPIHPQVIETMENTMKEAYANPSSSHQSGRKARQVYNQARQVFADSINAREDEIIMTSCGTESDNMAILGVAHSRKHLGQHIISTEVEHPGVKKALNILEDEGFDVSYLPVDEQGHLSMSSFKKALREDTILVSVMAVNNETGNCFDLQAIGDYLKEQNSKAYFHTDAVQAYSLMDIDVEKIALDLLAVSSHKINGPKGIGFLYKRKGVDLPPLIVGGGQENGYRAGTENVPAMAGFAKAVEIIKDQQARKRQNIIELSDYFLEQLDDYGIDYSINGDRNQSMGHVLNLHLHGVEASSLMIQLDMKSIAVSAGSACSAGSVSPSPVLSAMYGADHPAVHQSIRFSFGLNNTAAQIDRLAESLNELIKKG